MGLVSGRAHLLPLSAKNRVEIVGHGCLWLQGTPSSSVFLLLWPKKVLPRGREVRSGLSMAPSSHYDLRASSYGRSNRTLRLGGRGSGSKYQDGPL